MPCSECGDSPVHSRGLCNYHYAASRRGPASRPKRRRFMSDSDWFWLNVDKSGTCWVWTGTTNKQGYGSFKYRTPATKSGWTDIAAHRYSLMMTGVEVVGRSVLHACDNPPCVRPDHLRTGNHEANNRDTILKGRFPNGINSEVASKTLCLYLNGDWNIKNLAEEIGISEPSVQSLVRDDQDWRWDEPFVSSSEGSTI